jgi:hypothetical protein
MKIPILIQGKKYSIKPIRELNTAEFLELSKIKDLDIVKYIAWQTKVKFKDAFFAVTSKTIETAVGQIPDVTKLPRPKGFDYTKLIETVGQRHQVEACNLTGYELLVFVLAVAQARSTNIDDVNKLRDAYLTRPFTDILPAGFFFFKTLQPGKKSGVKSFAKQVGLISTRILKKLRDRKGLRRIVTS